VSRAISPSSGKPYGLARVCRVWRMSRATVHRHRASAPASPPRRRGPSGPMANAALLEATRAILSGCPFHGEGHRKVWARLRMGGICTSRRRVSRLMGQHGLLAPSRVGSPKGPRNHDGTIIPDRVDAMWGTDLTTTCQARKSNCRRKHAGCVRSNAQPHPESCPPVGKPSRRPGTRPPCRADTSPPDRSSRQSRASSPRQLSRSATSHRGRAPTPGAAGQRHCRAHACARSPWFVGRGCQDRERREGAAATLQIDPPGEMLCFASAQDRTDPRRIKGYFNANGRRPPTWGHLTVCSKLHGKTHARTAYLSAGF